MSYKMGFVFLAGDFVKFGFTMASTTTILAWGCLSYTDAYKDASKYQILVKMIKLCTFSAQRNWRNTLKINGLQIIYNNFNIAHLRLV